MFCSHTSYEEDQEWINRRGMVSKNAQNDKAKRFLDELTIFSVAPVEPAVHSAASQASAIKPEWKTAVDPHSGGTYYYDSITRKTQWEKPAEIKAMEKSLKMEKRKQLRAFFKEMEDNIYKSLERGEHIPGIKELAIEAPPREPMVPVMTMVPAMNGKSRIRTISGMDESLLAELKLGTKPSAAATVPVASKSHSTAPIRGRPPLPTGRRSNRELDTIDSFSLSPEEIPVKKLSHMESDVAAELAGESLLDGPINEAIGLDSESTMSAGQKFHVRRNTGGTIYVKTTMMNPDIQATIKCVCGVYRAHILQASEKRSTCSPVSVIAFSQENQLYRVFLDDPSEASPSLPSLDEIISFYQDFYQRSQMEHDTIIMSLIYVERLIKETNGQLVPGAENWKSNLFSCMVLASKVWDDLSMWNVDFSNVCGRGHSAALSSFTLPRINELELAILQCLKFIVRVPASEYAKYYFLIRSMLLKSGVLDEGAVVQGAKTLETLSANDQEATSTADNRRTKSLADFAWMNPCLKAMAGPVLQQSACLEQLVTMNR